MAVRRIRRPVPVRGENLGDQQTIGNIALFHRNRIDIAGVGPLAAWCGGNASGANDARFMPAMPRRRAHRNHTIRRRNRTPINTVRQIQAMRRGAVKNAHALAQLPPVLPRARDMRLALDQHHNDLAITGSLGHLITRFQMVQRKTDIGPIGGFLRFGDLDSDVMDLTSRGNRFAQQRAHLTRAPLGKNALQGAAMHIQTSRRFGYIAIT